MNALSWERGNWLIQPIEQWSQFFVHCNWYTFNPVLVEFEDDTLLGAVEVTAILLGVGFRVRWNHTETDAMRKIVAQVTEASAATGDEG